MIDAELRTTSAVIEACGGFNAVATLTGSKYKAVWNWSQAEHFPSKTYVVITDELKRRRLRASSSLWKMMESAEAAE